MPQTSRLHLTLPGLLLCAAAAHAQAPSPDARLASLYTEEWTWRLRELARTDQPGEAAAADHFPRVDAASDGPVHRGRRHQPVAQATGLKGS